MTPKVFSYARFSSPEQAKGHSLERQVQRARQWCEERGLTLEDELSDLGLSAFHGSHLSNGALGRFVAMVEAGKIPPGSTLLVEQLDRLTRQDLHSAQGLLWRILDHGIRVVTIADGQEFTKEQGLGGAIMALVTLAASHQESAKKADRVKASWGRRYEAAKRGEIITRNLPGWLTVKDGKIVTIPERAATLKEMFQLASEGMGALAIANHLNKKGAATWKGAANWRKASVYKLLQSPAAIGTLILKMSSGEKAVESYYPAVIDKALFDRVQKSLKDRTLVPGSTVQRVGRNQGSRNLFSGFAFCGECGGRMAIVDNRTRGSSRWPFKLVCDNARLKRGCKYRSIHYQPVEDAILKYCSEVDLSVLMAGGDNEPEIEAARARVQALKDAVQAKEGQVEAELQLSAMVTSPEMIKRLAERLDALQAELTKTKNDLDEAENDLARVSSAGNALIERVETIKKLTGGEGSTVQDIEIRRKLRAAFANAIERIDFFPEGFGDRLPVFNDDNKIEILPPGEWGKDLPSEEREFLELLTREEKTRDNAAFFVQFKNGHGRLFKWSKYEKAFVQSMVSTKAFHEWCELPERRDSKTGELIKTEWEKEVERYVKDDDFDR